MNTELYSEMIFQNIYSIQTILINSVNKTVLVISLYITLISRSPLRKYLTLMCVLVFYFILVIIII